MKEEARLFGKTNSLVGILTSPDGLAATPDVPAVLFLNAGLIHRIGPSRIYVKIARQLAAAGFPVLRFDLSGIGDSKPRQDNMPFEKSAVDDAQQAMDFLTKELGVTSFVLMGHCAGAFNSFATASADSRVRGAVLINPEGANDDWSDFDRKRKTSRYYEGYYSRSALTSRDRWVKLLTGRASYSSIIRNVAVNIIWNRISTVAFRLRKRFVSNPEADKQTQDTVAALRGIVVRGGLILFVYSEGSTGFMRVQGLFNHELQDLNAAGKVKLEIIPKADHIFTLMTMQDDLAEAIGNWMNTTIRQSKPAADSVMA